MRVYVVSKWPLPGRSRFVCWNITLASLWLLCNVLFVQSTQKNPPTDKTVRAWYKQFTETGCLCKQKSSGSPLTAEDDVERVRTSFLHSPKKSTELRLRSYQFRLSYCSKTEVPPTSTVRFVST